MGQILSNWNEEEDSAFNNQGCGVVPFRPAQYQQEEARRQDAEIARKKKADAEMARKNRSGNNEATNDPNNGGKPKEESSQGKK